jgi:4'-phosphopantetheinyl transferase
MQCTFYTCDTKNSPDAFLVNSPLLLGADEIHIHLLRPEFCVDAYKATLDSSEQQRAQAFKFSKDRDLYVAAHVFLRQVLSRYACVPAKAWQFSCNRYGKPAIANPGHQWLQFNLAHTKGMVACAVARNRAVGVDVEHRKYLEDLPSLCHQAFSPIEARAVLAHQLPDDREHCFFNYWTLKEAYIKARGLGLSLPLQTFSFVQKADQSWYLQHGLNFPDDGENWYMGTRLLAGDLYLAYCIQNSSTRLSRNGCQ